ARHPVGNALRAARGPEVDDPALRGPEDGVHVTCRRGAPADDSAIVVDRESDAERHLVRCRCGQRSEIESPATFPKEGDRPSGTGRAKADGLIPTVDGKCRALD